MNTTQTLLLKSKKAALVFRAINHKLRHQIVQYLLAHPGTGVTALYLHFHLEQSVASQHLSILRKEGVVRTERGGKQIFYYVNESRLKEIEAAVDQLLVKPGDKTYRP